MKPTLFIALVIIFITSSCKNDYLIEDQVCECIRTSYDSLGIDISFELMEFEKHLIETGVLKNNSGEEFLDQFAFTVKYNESNIKSDFMIPSLDNLDFIDEPFRKCQFEYYHKYRKIHSGSKFIQIGNRGKEMGEYTPSNASKIWIDILTPEDFNNEFYRLRALMTFYLVRESSVQIEESLPKRTDS